QEIFLERNVDQLNAKVFLDVGGTFDVLAGAVKRAPKFYLDYNLEWLYRSLSMKRYDRLVQIPKYLYSIVRHRDVKMENKVQQLDVEIKKEIKEWRH
ncbi:WecB/TagA/CpsF family glycosyltransferase, partial [Vibrio parahaemolyticus]|nr:WecB/TagA/CpsF family glycosyltransferase [Vibrio parahaemolyticus]